jgi:hypothetical protein
MVQLAKLRLYFDGSLRGVAVYRDFVYISCQGVGGDVVKCRRQKNSVDFFKFCYSIAVQYMKI